MIEFNPIKQCPDWYQHVFGNLPWQKIDCFPRDKKIHWPYPIDSMKSKEWTKVKEVIDAAFSFMETIK